MSWVISACSSSGPAVGRFSTIGDDDGARDELRQHPADGRDERVEREPHRIVQRSGVNSGRPLARAVVDVGLVSSSSRLARMMRIRVAVPLGAEDDDRDPEMREQVDDLGPATRAH